MSDQSIGAVGEGEEFAPSSAVFESSLAARMAGRREELEQDTTRVFPLPAYDSILAIEFRMLGWQTQRNIARVLEKKVKDPALFELYVAAESLIRAFETLHEVLPSGETQPTGYSIIEVARASGLKLGEDVTPRQALIALVGDTRVMTLYSDYMGWVGGQREDHDEDVMRDFAGTGSPS
jgi:hypothetical protein